jgi:hypothetical protein
VPPYTLPRTRALKLDPPQKLQAELELLGSHAGWRTTWSHLVAGREWIPPSQISDMPRVPH